MFSEYQWAQIGKFASVASIASLLWVVLGAMLGRKTRERLESQIGFYIGAYDLPPALDAMDRLVRATQAESWSDAGRELEATIRSIARVGGRLEHGRGSILGPARGNVSRSADMLRRIRFSISKHAHTEGDLAVVLSRDQERKLARAAECLYSAQAYLRP